MSVSSEVICQLFERAASQSPDKVAVISPMGQMLYSKLKESAVAIAAFLLREGLTPEEPVVVISERSPWMLVAILGVMKAGGAYVPIEPDYPPARQKDIIQSSGARFILFSPGYKPLDNLDDVTILDISEIAAKYANVDFLFPELLPNHLAYILFTSGSTGKPKGVMIEHASVINYLRGFDMLAPVPSPLIGSSICPYVFDVSVWEFFSVLCNGGTLHLVNPMDIYDTHWFAGYLIDNKINSAYLAPGILEGLATELALRGACPLSRILVGVEPILEKTLSKYLTLNPAMHIINGYGPTEATISCTFYKFMHVVDPNRRTPIGKAIDGYEVWVVHDDFTSCQAGESGEILIGGKGLARGYLNDEELTNQKFIQHPFKPDSGEKVFRTGDRARLLPDGHLIFEGRMDFQLKIRGYRIEPGDVEAHILKYEGVEECVTVGLESATGVKFLVAYVVMRPEADFDEARLREFLASYLPDFMIPSVFVRMERLPRTAAGKIDRRALPSPKSEKFTTRHSSEAGGGFLHLVREVWSEILHVFPSPDDNFFVIGGDSIKAAQIMSRLCQRLGGNWPISLIFSHPTPESLALILEKTYDTVEVAESLPLANGHVFPLSFNQQRPILLSLLGDDTSIYNFSIALQFKNALNSAAIKSALYDLTIRHSALRTSFMEVDGNLSQMVHERGRVVVDEISLKQEENIYPLLQNNAAFAFDLGKLPLFKAFLYHTPQGCDIFQMVVHHSIADGWTMGLLFTELTLAYNARINHKAPVFDVTPEGYPVFTLYERQKYERGKFRDGLRYFANLLEDAPPQVQLPTSKQRPREFTFTGASYFFYISPGLISKVEEFAANHNQSVFTLLMAAFSLTLKSYTNRDDMVVGTMAANRTHPAFEQTAGFFSNTLLMRLQPESNLTLIQYLNMLAAQANRSFSHQDLPYELLLQHLNPPRNLSFNPLFQFMLIYQNMPLENLSLNGIDSEVLEVHTLKSKLDLSITFDHTSSGLRGHAEYYSEIYDEALIKAFCNKMINVLSQIVEMPTRKIKELNVLSEVELGFITEKAENSGEYVVNISIPDLFKRISSELPGKAAILYGDNQLTYEQFCAESDALAAFLSRNGIKTFGLLALRHPDTLVAMMAALKAGVVWVPISTGYPKDRVKLMALDAAFDCILGYERTESSLLEQIDFHDIRGAIEKGKKLGGVLIPTLDLDTTAYILFTSGSTGKPKGVEVSHRSLANFVQSTILSLKISNIDRILQFADLSFDTCLEEIFPALCAGASLILRDDQLVEELDTFWRKVDHWGITILDLPTAFWGQLMVEAELNPPEIPENLRMVIIGGEAATPAQVRTFQKLTHNRITLVNTYGPTETTVVATTYIFQQNFELPYVPIGRPIYNTGVWIVDKNLKPVVPGTEGELLVSGICLAKGYAGRPELTREKFFDWSAPDKNTRHVYRTGDRVWMMPDGNIVYSGRIDKQLKIRGYRVEADEILHYIRQLPGIKDAVLDLWHQKLLTVWYVFAEANTKPEVSLWKQHLSRWLPSYMIPVAWVQIESIPLTPRGKIDFSRLPDPDSLLASGEIIAPQTPLQQKMVDVWAQVLQLPEVGINQNFFDLGGNSILAASLVSRLSTVLRSDITLRMLFRNPSILALSDVLEQEDSRKAKNKLSRLEHAPGGQLIQASPTQRRIWFLQQLEGANAAYNIPMEYLIAGSFNLTAFNRAIQYITERHEALRSCIRPYQDIPYYYVEKKISIIPEIIELDQLSDAEKEAELSRFRKEFNLFLFDLFQAPLFRISIVKLNTDAYLLLFNFHHLIFDNWSAGIFIKELNEAYGRYIINSEPSLPTPQFQYSDYIWWFNQRSAAGDLSNGLDFWKKKLQGIPHAINLPFDFSRKTRQTFDGAEYKLEIPATLSRYLKEFSTSHNATLFHTLLAGFAVLLQRYTAQDDLVVGCPVANRKHPDLEEIIGVFINNLPIRFTLDNPVSFVSLVHKTRELWSEAEEHQEVPFEQMVEVLSLKRDLSLSPIFQVMFDFLNAHNLQPSFENCRVSYRPSASFVAKYDISLIVVEYGGNIHLTFEYNTYLFKYNSIRQLAHNYLRLLDLALQNKDKPVQHLDLVTLKGMEYLLGKINTEPKEFPAESVVGLVSKAAAHNPLKSAVETEERKLSYAALMFEVNRMAAQMINAGVRPGNRIAVMLERNWQLPVALLSVMRCGATYIPLDPVYPEERIKHIMDDARPEFTITEPAFNSWFEGSGSRILYFTDEESVLPEQWPTSASRDPAYIIYTSGSTGKPKGVVISMESLVNFLWAVRDVPGFTKDDRLLAVTTVSFDISGLELYLPLICGGTLVLASHQEAMDVHLLIKKLNESKITYMQATPVTWRMLSFAGWEGNQNLKVLCGGEALQQDLSNYLVNRCKEVWNMYGPTETTIWSSAHRVRLHDVPDRYEPIGRPLANNFFYVLDKFGKMTPEGVPGELYIGGKGVALGYFNNSVLTHKRFHPDPFIGASGGLMYQTGDLVRLLPEGVFEYLGRLDNQVKIRGFRIELGEIETVLSNYPGVLQAVVVVREEIPNSPRLVAYYRIAEDVSLDLAQLCSYLVSQLPDFMIPQAFVQLEEFPLTPNGKIDRRALPEPSSYGLSAHGLAEPPVTTTEHVLVDLWKEVLKTEGVGRNSDFFELGGHSLLAVTLMGKIEHLTGKRIPLAILFTHSKLEQLASYIDHADIRSDWRSLVRLKPFGNKVPLFLIHAAGLNVMLYNSMVNNLSVDQPVYGLQAKGLSGYETPLSTIEEIAAHYIAEIKSVAPHGPFAFAGFSLGGIIAFEMARQLVQQGEVVSFVGMFDTVAFTSDKHMPLISRYLRRIKIALMKVAYIIWLFLTDKETRKAGLLDKKFKSLKWRLRRLRFMFKAQQVYLKGDKDNLPEYLHDVHELNTRAMENYVLKPSPIAIDLFRASRQTFYIEEPKTYGWSKYALKGVNIHHIPGEHSTIFWPPYDKIVAEIIQQRLDKVTLESQKGLSKTTE